MTTMLRFATLAAVLASITAATTGVAQRGTTSVAAPATTPADTTARIVASAQTVLAALDTTGKSRVQFPFEGPQKTRWSNLPSPMFERRGLRLGDLTPAQKTAVMNLLQAALSRPGYDKVVNI